MKKEKRITSVIFLSITLLISIFLINAADPLGLTDKLDPDLLQFLYAIAPLIVLFIFSIISIVKANRTLMALQLLLWWVYTIFILVKVFAYFDIIWNFGFLGTEISKTLITFPTEGKEYSWSVIGLFINAIVGLFMSLKNSYITSMFGKATRVRYVNNYQI